MPCRGYEYVELYLDYRYTPSWRVRGKLYFLLSFIRDYPHISFVIILTSQSQQWISAWPSSNVLLCNWQVPYTNPGQATAVFLNEGKRQGSTSNLAPINSHPFKFVAHKHPTTRLYSPVNALVFIWLPNYGPNPIRKTTSEHMLSDVTERTVSSQPFTQLRSAIPSFISSRLILQRSISSSYTHPLSLKVYLCAGFPHQNMAIVNKPKSYQHTTYTRNRSGSTARAVFRHPYCDLTLQRALQCRVQRRMPSGRNASFVAGSHASEGPGLE
jgi:hypothetical protein